VLDHMPAADAVHGPRRLSEKLEGIRFSTVETSPPTLGNHLRLGIATDRGDPALGEHLKDGAAPTANIQHETAALEVGQ